MGILGRRPYEIVSKDGGYAGKCKDCDYETFTYPSKEQAKINVLLHRKITHEW